MSTGKQTSLRHQGFASKGSSMVFLWETLKLSFFCPYFHELPLSLVLSAPYLRMVPKEGLYTAARCPRNGISWADHRTNIKINVYTKITHLRLYGTLWLCLQSAQVIQGQRCLCAPCTRAKPIAFPGGAGAQRLSRERSLSVCLSICLSSRARQGGIQAQYCLLLH